MAEVGVSGGDAVLSAIERDDSYRVVRTLAEGAGGTTELVTRDGTELVRKRIPRALANRAAWEAARGASLSCPRLPAIRDVYELPDVLCAVYDYVGGESLEGYVGRRGRLDAAEAARIAREVCAAAGALHAAGVVHRDITPANVVVARDGVYLVDLGIARVMGHGAQGDAPARTHDTTTLGTYGFAAPEQFGFARTDARSDVYAIGRLFAFMLTGVRPDDPAFEGLLADRALASERAAVVVARACAFEPSARYASAAELARALASLAERGGNTLAASDGARPARAATGLDGAPAASPVRAREVAPPERFSRNVPVSSVPLPDGGLRSGRMPKGRRVVLTALLACAGVACVLVLAATIVVGSEQTTDAVGVVTTVIMLAGELAAADLAVIEPLRAVWRQGPYGAGRSGRARPYLAALMRDVAIFSGVCVAGVLVGALFMA